MSAFMGGMFTIMSEPRVIETERDGKKLRGVNLFMTYSQPVRNTNQGEETEWLSIAVTTTKWCYSDKQFEFFKKLQKKDRVFLCGDIDLYKANEGNETKISIKPSTLEFIGSYNKSNNNQEQAEAATGTVDLPRDI